MEICLKLITRLVKYYTYTPRSGTYVILHQQNLLHQNKIQSISYYLQQI